MPMAPTLAAFTPRQEAVLQAIVDGKTYETIADEMSISINGVRGHVRAIENKLGVRGRREIPLAARVRGLL